MQVRNRLPAALAHVCRYAVTLSDSFGVGDLTSKSESLAKKWIMLTAQVMNGRDVVSCHNEDMNRGPRELVPESDNVISLRYPHGRLLASHYPTEQARLVVHVSSEPRLACGQSRRKGAGSHREAILSNGSRFPSTPDNVVTPTFGGR